MADRSRLTANVAAVVLLVAVAAALVAWQRPWASPSEPDAAGPLPADARAIVVRQFQAMSSADTRAEFVDAVGSSEASRELGQNIWDACRVLGIRDADYAYKIGGDAADRADGTTSAVVTVTWRGGTSDVRFRLRPTADGFDVVSVSNVSGRRLPVWLAGDVRVAKAPGLTVVEVDGGRPGLDVNRLARTAARQVRTLVPNAAGSLTVIAPSEPATSAALLGRPVSRLTQVAAVSAQPSGGTGGPAVVLNAPLFAGMDARARQVVMTHEATHVLTRIVGREATLWVVEGFADYVALHDDRAPLSVSAGDALRRVKTAGAPRTLPTAEDFDETSYGLGSAYELAWLAFRMLGADHGDAAVVGFYDDVIGGASVNAAAEDRFGLARAQLTAAWRAYLTKSASTVS